MNIKSLAGETALDWATKIGGKTVIDTLTRAGGVRTPAAPVPPPAFAPVDLRSAAQRGVALMEKTGAGTAAAGGCASCHSHNITDLVTNLARTKGLQVDEKAASDRRTLTRVPYFITAHHVGTPTMCRVRQTSRFMRSVDWPIRDKSRTGSRTASLPI